MRRSALRRLSETSPRDLLAVGLPLLLILIAGFWVAARFMKPAPPDTLVIATGSVGGAYQSFAEDYRDVLEEYGIKLVTRPSAGSIENLARLRDERIEVDAGFYQAGTGEPTDDDDLYSLGAFYYEPLWIFYRDGLAVRGDLDRVLQLKGRRIAVGAEGSGTRQLALAVLHAGGIDDDNATLTSQSGAALAAALAKGEIDAACVVGSPTAATVAQLLIAPGVRLMNLAHAEAYSRQLPYLSRIVLPRGGVDVAHDIPPRDISLVATTSTLLVRGDTHPALVGLLTQAASESHGGAGLFNRPGEFPRAIAVDFPLAKEAERYYKSGKPFLQRYLPFWAATLVDRMIVLLVPILGLLVPIVKFAPTLYGWRVRRRIYRYYGELKFLEAEVGEDPKRHTRAEWLARLDAIEDAVNQIPTPLAFSDMFYTLRSHIPLVREAIGKKATDA